jgi:hypothetical protein
LSIFSREWANLIIYKMKTKEEFLNLFAFKPKEQTGNALYSAYELGYEDGKSDWAYQWNK